MYIFVICLMESCKTSVICVNSSMVLLTIDFRKTRLHAEWLCDLDLWPFDLIFISRWGTVSWWTIPVQVNLVVLVSAVLVLSCRQTDRQTESQTPLNSRDHRRRKYSNKRLYWLQVFRLEDFSFTDSFQRFHDESHIMFQFLFHTRQCRIKLVFLQAITRIITESIQLKVSFHYPSSRTEFTGRVDGPRTRVNFLTPVNSGRQLG